MQEIQFGSYALPVILTIALAFIFKIFEHPDGTSSLSNRWKPLIAIIVGTSLGIMGVFYRCLQPTFPVLVDHVLYGFMSGASAVGLWEGYVKAKGK